jgi:GT2 family glycosyltransferase
MHTDIQPGLIQGLKPLVSVVIPTHNRATLLEKAIGSVAVQEGSGELFDLEVIVVDDASTDNTSEVMKKYPWVQYIRLVKNRGASGARNEGIKAATGKYIALLDDDDVFLTHKLLIQVPILEANQDIGVVYGQSVITGGSNPLELWPLTGPSGHVFEKFVTLTEDFLHPPTWLVRRELFEKAGYFDESKAGMEHYDMALRIAFLVPWFFLSGGPVARGHFSSDGLWFRNIVNGTMERQLPLIIEGALAMLPSTDESDQVRRKARTAVSASIAKHKWADGYGVEPTRAHLLATLRTSPWMIREPSIVEHLTRVASNLSAHSQMPAATILAFWKEIWAATGMLGLRQTLHMWWLLGEFFQEAATELKSVGSPRMAAVMSISAVVIDPMQLIRKRAVKLLRSLCDLDAGGFSHLR